MGRHHPAILEFDHGHLLLLLLLVLLDLSAFLDLRVNEQQTRLLLIALLILGTGLLQKLIDLLRREWRRWSVLPGHVVLHRLSLGLPCVLLSGGGASYLLQVFGLQGDEKLLDIRLSLLVQVHLFADEVDDGVSDGQFDALGGKLVG